MSKTLQTAAVVVGIAAVVVAIPGVAPAIAASLGTTAATVPAWLLYNSDAADEHTLYDLGWVG